PSPTRRSSDLRARRLRLPPDERRGAGDALSAAADARRRLRGHHALSPDALLRHSDSLRRDARGEGRGEAVRRLLASPVRLGGRGAAGGALPPLARAL